VKSLHASAAVAFPQACDLRRGLIRTSWQAFGAYAASVPSAGRSPLTNGGSTVNRGEMPEIRGGWLTPSGPVRRPLRLDPTTRAAFRTADPPDDVAPAIDAVSSG
jgi:hypothetical protein